MAGKKTPNTAHILLMSHSPAESWRRGEQLEAVGWHVVQAADSVAALSAAKGQRVDLALLHLPVDDMVAMDLPNVLRSVCPAEYLPVIILADNPAEQHRCRFLDSGADDVISLSTSADEAVARIRAMLRIKRLHDQLATSRLALEESLDRERRLMGKLRRENDHLQILVTTDPLTRVQNRRSLLDLLEHEFKIARRYGQSLSLLCLDVDHFKVVNDSHGHPSGDYVLKELAVILTRAVRDSDVVARTGGEEFCVLLPKAGREQAAQFAERIRTEICNRKFIVHGETIHVTASLGAATWPADAEITEPEMLYYFGDQALLVAKESGRDRVVAACELDPAVRNRLRRQYEAAPAAPEEPIPCPSALEPI